MPTILTTRIGAPITSTRCSTSSPIGNLPRRISAGSSFGKKDSRQEAVLAGCAGVHARAVSLREIPLYDHPSAVDGDTPGQPPSGILFDAYGTLFDVYSLGLLSAELFPKHGAALAVLWRRRGVGCFQAAAP